MKTTERRQWRHSGVFITNLEHIFQLFFKFVLLNLAGIKLNHTRYIELYTNMFNELFSYGQLPVRNLQ